MPIREFRCEDCKEEFEEFLMAHDCETVIIKCPSCGSQQIKQLLSCPAAFILKGAGFYKQSAPEEDEDD